MAIAVAVLGLGLSIVTQLRVSKLGKQNAYVDLDRKAEVLITLPLEDDRLNKLFFESVSEVLPDPMTNWVDLNEEQRALVNYATLVLTYYEQVVILDRKGTLPYKMKATWDTWIEEGVHPPYFLWAWKMLERHFHPLLSEAIRQKAREASVTPIP